jgi:hypothetical protein
VALTDAQARARRYPKATPGFERDAGWEGDPTEGNEDLVRIIKARQAACLMTFAAKRRRPPGSSVDCTREGADSLGTMLTAQGYAEPMPAPRALTLPLLPAGTENAAAFRAFMRAMGDELAREIEVSPISGVALHVSRQMFTHHATGRSKLDKRGRSAFVIYLAEAILRPDEAWLSTGGFDDRTLTLIGRYARGRDEFGAAAVFKEQGSIWVGWSAYQSFKDSYIQSLRSGVVVYRRP